MKRARKLLGISLLTCLAFTLTACSGRRVDIGPALAEAKELVKVPQVRNSNRTSQPMPRELFLEEAVLRALENNRSLAVERLEPLIARTDIEAEKADFDALHSATAGTDVSRSQRATGGELFSRSHEAGYEISRKNPSGTTYGASLDVAKTSANNANDRFVTRAGLFMTKALKRGRGHSVNLASIRQAELDVELTNSELRGFAETLVATVEETYWQLLLAKEQVAIFKASLELARRQLSATKERVAVGGMAEMEMAAAQTEIALREEALINARSRVETLEVRLLRLIEPKAMNLGERNIDLATKAVLPDEKLDTVAEHVRAGLTKRPELQEARLRVQREDIELIKTRNGLLPKMDLFLNLGESGYARSFGSSFGLTGSEGYDVAAGVTFELPHHNREARASHERAKLTKTQLEESLRNLEDLVREDVEVAYIELKRTKEQVQATAATRRLQEEKLRAEMAKFKVGKTTSLLVAQVQRDLVESQVSEVEARTNCAIALIELYRLDGTLLERRGIKAPR